MSRKALIFFCRSFRTEARYKRFGLRNRRHAERIVKRISTEVLQEVRRVPVDRFWFSDVPIPDGLLKRFGFLENVLQSGEDLREKVLNSFLLLFARGYEEVTIVGNDTLLSSGEISKAFSVDGDAFGRSCDGGFYLLKLCHGSGGLKILTDIFWNDGKPDADEKWFFPLAVKHDLDTLKDLLSLFPDAEMVRWLRQELGREHANDLDEEFDACPLLEYSLFNRPPPFLLLSA